MQADLEIDDGVDQRLCAPTVLHPTRDSQDTPSLWTVGRENAVVWNRGSHPLLLDADNSGRREGQGPWSVGRIDQTSTLP